MGDARKGFILDGFPRTTAQADGLSRLLGDNKIDQVLNLVVPAETVVARLKDRWLCGQCGAIYNLKTAPPKVAGVCDKCGGALKQRTDDQPDTVRTRLEVYEKETAPLVAYYRRNGVLQNIDASGTPDAVYAAIQKAVGKVAA
jgi:adenylate kinase